VPDPLGVVLALFFLDGPIAETSTFELDGPESCTIAFECLPAIPGAVASKVTLA